MSFPINRAPTPLFLLSWPCQQLHGGTGEAIYSSIDGLCTHLECHPSNDDRVEGGAGEEKIVEDKLVPKKGD